MDNNIKLIVVGLGYWGPNLLRTFNNLGVVKAAFDLDDDILHRHAENPAYNDIHFCNDYEEFLTDSHNVDGVVIATPPDTHYNIAMTSLAMGKHVFIEKPMTLNSAQAESIAKLADTNGLTVLVGHIFLYSPEIIKLKEIINSEDFGDVLYIYTQRLNLGKIQSPANVIEDLAPHDISILDYLLEDTCTEVLTTAASHVVEGIEDVAFISMKYSKGVTAHLHLSWLDPLKIRNTVVVGTKQMVVCDSGGKKIDIYNKSVDIDERKHMSNLSYAQHLLSYKYGDVISPYIEGSEPMLKEAQDFLKCIKSGKAPVANSHIGVSAVKVLEAMQRSLKGGQKWEKV